MTAVLLFIIVALVVGRMFVVVWYAASDWRRRKSADCPVEAGVFPRVTVLVPAYNEAEVIEQTLIAIGDCDYPGFEILVIDDGSTDHTADLVRKLQPGIPNLRLLVQESNRGKARALNAGIQESRGEIVVTVDADTRPEPDTIRILVAGFEKPAVAAVAGNVKVGNRTGLLTRWQAIEYINGYNLDRRAQARLGCITTIPGALGAYRKKAIEEVGMFSADTVAEDTDLTLALHQSGCLIAYADRARAHTQAPTRLTDLFRQRLRWVYGNIQAGWKHRKTCRQASARSLRWFGMPNFWYRHIFVHLLLPISLLFLPYLLTHYSRAQMVIFLASWMLVDLIITVASVAMDQEDRRLLWVAPLQRVVYPFFLWAVFASVLVRMFMRKRCDWYRVRPPHGQEGIRGTEAG